MRTRTGPVVLLTALVLLVAAWGTPAASADPSADGWRTGWCRPGEGLTVVVDFGAENPRGWEARCRIGGDYPGTGTSRIAALESVGYPVAEANGVVTTVDGTAGGEADWWMYSSSQGIGPWSTTTWELPPDRVLTDWFYGVCLGSGPGCVPRVAPRFEASGAPASVTVTGTSRAAYGQTARLQVRVTTDDGAPTGTVRLSGAGAALSRTLTSGSATFDLPRTLAVGTYRMTATYEASTGGTATGAWTLTVAKGAAGAPSTTVTQQPTGKRRGKVTVRVATGSGLAPASGAVVVVLAKGKVQRTVRASVVRGAAKVRLPRLAKGTWRAKVTYRGDARYDVAVTTFRVRVR
ncbi:Ig-like domain repeat protein [Pimelobacter simplex]|uniref:Ig-like domain repeat protein n=1 Tax=Nocardioides simplex TaxID=2045 RepID=UPI003AAC2B94